ncbi:hypothetical protein Zm00014a_010926 [Zea mays]|jgi:hypothetical protein|uniref:Uncharacterized protein n=1 Tax=Zea mays TaxID=4577 RepID=A0A3L6DJV8_MAIZE|nr:hypothetical protein Zm00014a_010926 [Zea mays]
MRHSKTYTVVSCDMLISSFTLFLGSVSACWKVLSLHKSGTSTKLNKVSFPKSHCFHIVYFSYFSAPFTKKEIRVAILGLDYNKAPSFDGFSAEYYMNFWKNH